jgi:hypothetical protein
MIPFTGIELVLFDTVYHFTLLMEPVIAEFILHPQKDEQGGRQADGEACYVDKCEGFLTGYVPERYKEKITDHGFNLWVQAKDGQESDSLHRKPQKV